MNDYQLLKLSENQDCEAYMQDDFNQENTLQEEINDNILSKTLQSVKSNITYNNLQNNFANNDNQNNLQKTNKNTCCNKKTSKQSNDLFKRQYQDYYDDIKLTSNYIKEDW